MNHNTVCCAGITPALAYAKQYLQQQGIPMTDAPGWNTRHLLLDVPTFRPGFDRGSLDTLLASLPRDAVIWGGNLDTDIPEELRTVDLLKDETYLARNAAITADCTLKIASPLLKTTWPETPALVIGWGRIGKCLARLLKDMGCPVTVAARKERDRAALSSLGFTVVGCNSLAEILPEYRLILNTVPAMMIAETDFSSIENIVVMDLASQKGIQGSKVIWARGLPGIHAPESAGRLIAETFLRKVKEVTP